MKSRPQGVCGTGIQAGLLYGGPDEVLVGMETRARTRARARARAHARTHTQPLPSLFSSLSRKPARCALTLICTNVVVASAAEAIQSVRSYTLHRTAMLLLYGFKARMTNGQSMEKTCAKDSLMKMRGWGWNMQTKKLTYIIKLASPTTEGFATDDHHHVFILSLSFCLTLHSGRV